MREDFRSKMQAKVMKIKKKLLVSGNKRILQQDEDKKIKIEDLGHEKKQSDMRTRVASAIFR